MAAHRLGLWVGDMQMDRHRQKREGRHRESSPGGVENRLLLTRAGGVFPCAWTGGAAHSTGAKAGMGVGAREGWEGREGGRHVGWDMATKGKRGREKRGRWRQTEG